MQPATQNDLKKLGEQLTRELRQFEVVQENRYEDILGLLRDVAEYVKEIPGIKRTVSRHDLEIKHLNRKVFGYDSVIRED